MKLCLVVFLYTFNIWGRVASQTETADGDTASAIAVAVADPFPQDVLLEAERQVAAAINEEVAYALSLEENIRPFSQVQSFSGASDSPLSHQFNYPYQVARAASTIFLANNVETAVRKRRQLAVLGVPPSPRALRPDDPITVPETGECPYESYICDPLDPYRSFDGSCNNLQTPIWGRAFTPFRRDMNAVYADGIDLFKTASSGLPLPSARDVSVAIAPSIRKLNNRATIMGAYQWGQFVDHDVTKTSITTVRNDPGPGYGAVDVQCLPGGCGTPHPACVPIPIDPNDPDFGGVQPCLEFVRSEPILDLDCVPDAKAVLNQLTSFIDASNVYGSTEEEADDLRGPMGTMLTSQHPSANNRKDYLPHATKAEDQSPPKCFQGGNPNNKCFMAGDSRVNEVTSLTMMHTVWVREHNRIVAVLANNHPGWDSDRLFQETRKIVAAEMQHITYNEFLPMVIGIVNWSTLGLRPKSCQFACRTCYSYDYNDQTDPRISLAFSTAAYRFGHSMIPDEFPLSNDHLKPVFPPVDTTEAFSRPATLYDITTDGIDGYIQGMSSTASLEFDRCFVEQVTSRLFTQNPPHGLGTDLFSLNIQRGRDHGLACYNDWRQWCGLPRFNSFAAVEVEFGAQAALDLQSVYDSVDDIELYAGGVLEPNVPSGVVGPTFACIIGRQFQRLKQGDRFWHENPGQFPCAQLKEIKKTSLAKVLCDNAHYLPKLQPRVMRTSFQPLCNLLANFGVKFAFFGNCPCDCSNIPGMDLSIF